MAPSTPMLPYLTHLYESRLGPVLEAMSVPETEIAFVASGSLETVGKADAKAAGGAYCELILPADTPRGTVENLRTAVSRAATAPYTSSGLSWEIEGMQNTMRVDRLASPLGHLELACSPDTVYTLPKWNMQKAIVVRDVSGRYQSLRDKLAYFGEDEWNDRILSNEFFIHFRTFYDFPRSVQRGQLGSAYLLLGAAHAYVLRFVFLINRQFPPILEGGPCSLLPRRLAAEVRLLPHLGNEVSGVLTDLSADSGLQAFQRAHEKINSLRCRWLLAQKISLDSEFYNFDELGHRAAPARTDRHGGRREGPNPFRENDPRWTS